MATDKGNTEKYEGKLGHRYAQGVISAKARYSWMTINCKKY